MLKRPFDMRLIVALLIGVFASADARGREQVEAEPPLQPLATRQTMFSIPFRISKADRPTREPVEVQLFVSTDGGSAWELASRVPPSQGSFLFRAPHDGQYWFLVRTLDRNGQLRPMGPARAEMKVIVDTAPPSLQVEADRGDGGQVTARWSIEEPHLRVGSLRVQYRTGPNQPWESVAIDQRTISRQGPTLKGESTWWLPADVHRIEVRAEVFDIAGNPAVSHAQLHREPTRVPAKSVAATRPNRQQPQDTPSAKKVPPAQPNRAAAVAWQPDGTVAGDSPWSGSQADSTGPAADRRLQSPSNPNSAAGAPATAAQIEVGPSATRGAAASPVAEMHIRQQRSVPQAEAVAVRIHPKVGQQFPDPAGPGSAKGSPESRGPASTEYAGRPEPAKPGEAAGLQAPRGDSPPAPQHALRMVNTRLFEVEYGPEVASQGQGRVELWGTRDNGATWNSYGLDTDGQSPMTVTVGDPGIYGFRFAACDPGTGRSTPPAPGTRPNVWIGVDWTKPMARFTGISCTDAAPATELTIGWDARDWRLAPRPIALAYSQNVGGPWTTIAADLQNTGSYRWQPATPLPDEVYLRMEVRDEAGNVTFVESTEAVSLGQPQHRTRIREGGSAAQSKRPAPRRYYFR